MHERSHNSGDRFNLRSNNARVRADSEISGEKFSPPVDFIVLFLHSDLPATRYTQFSLLIHDSFFLSCSSSRWYPRAHARLKSITVFPRTRERTFAPSDSRINQSQKQNQLNSEPGPLPKISLTKNSAAKNTRCEKVCDPQLFVHAGKEKLLKI